MRCEQVAGRLAAAADGTERLDDASRRHVDRCLRCQAEAVQYRRVLRALHSMRTEVLEPAPGLLPEILAGLEKAAERRALRDLLRGRRVAYLAALAIAVCVTAVGAAVMAVRSRRRVPLAG